MKSSDFQVFKSQVIQPVTRNFLSSWRRSLRIGASWLLPTTAMLTVLPLSVWAGPPRRTVCGFTVPPGYVLIRYKYSDNCPGIGDNAIVVEQALILQPAVAPAPVPVSPNPAPPVTVQPPAPIAPAPAPVVTSPVAPPGPRPYPGGSAPGYPPYGTSYPGGYPASPSYPPTNPYPPGF